MNINDCDAVILCGGKGERLRGVISDVPKVMADVNGRPFLDYIIENLVAQGIERIILCTGYKAGTVENYYRDRQFGITIDFSTENKPLGTGGGLKHARDVITSDFFFALNGDSLVSADLASLLKLLNDNNGTAAVVVSRVKDGGDFGSIDADDEGRITAFHEKTAGLKDQWVNAGVYCFSRSVFDHMPGEDEFSIEKDFFPRLVGKGFYALKTEQEFLDIGTPQRYESVKQKLKQK